MSLKSIKIKGNNYTMVNERIKYFRTNYPEHSLTSRIIEVDAETCIVKAEIRDNNGNMLASGHAHEEKASNYINKTSFVENCETSAWGRALGNFGIGIDSSIASAEEVDMAVKKQESKPPLQKPSKNSKPKLTKKQLNDMMQYIKDGKKAQVMSAIKKYTISESYMSKLNDALIK